ncbi:MAG TPA: GAF domain-containing protein, partial [Lacunisphaera sp.]
TAQNSLFVIATAGGAAILGAIVLSVFLHRSVGRYIGERGRAEDALRRTNRALRTRSLCSQALVRSASEAALLNRLCEAIVSEGGYRFAWIGFADDDPEKNVRPVAQAGSDAGYLERARISWADSALGRGPTGNAIRTGRPSVCRDVRNDPDFAPWRDEALKRGFASSVVLPLLAEGRVFGALNIYATEAGVFDEAEVQLLSELADDLAFGIQAHRLRNERQRAQAALKEAAGYNRRLLEASLDPLVTIGADGRITDANVATETMTGRSRTELIGTDFSDYFTEPDKARAGYQQAFRDGLVRDYVLKMRHRDGRITTVLYNASVYRNEQGDITGVFAAARDVTERLRAEQEILHLNTDLEQRVRARTAELETANRELEAFSYSVSHDLRAPLRSIDGFSRIALNQPDDLLSAKTREALGYVREGAQQMGQLIDDLLVFSRLGRQPLRRGRVLPDQLVRSCLETLRPEREGRRVEIAIGDLPACEADAGLLKQVWMNLLANALKYSRKRDPARIEIGCQQNGENVYFVRDNGVGFKMAYAHKLFGVFQRLHRMEDYEGTGVGLATAHRIVSRHGGRIWAEAEIDRGATFFFTLGAAGSSLATSRDAPATPEMVSTSCSSQRVTPPTETTNALAVHERTS